MSDRLSFIAARYAAAIRQLGSGSAKSADAEKLEVLGWKALLDTLWPGIFDAPFTPEHTEFWTWAWSVLVKLRAGALTAEDRNAVLALLPRGFGKSTHAEIFLALAVCVLGQGVFLLVSGTQDLANAHLATVVDLLTSEGVKRIYPHHSRPKKSSITGQHKAWKQERVETEGGAVVWAIGLNVGIRGIRKSKDRVRVFVLDDVDDYADSPQVSLNKANTLGNSVLPTSALQFAVVGVQNLITEHSVFNRIYTRADMMLANRICIGPTPAFDDLRTEFQDGRDLIVSARPRWPERVTIEVGQRFIDTFGLVRFLAEFQHDFTSNKQGLCFSNYDDAVHVITRTEFCSVFGVREPPDRWYKYVAHDTARTKSAFHANVCLKITVSGQNQRLPGCIFLYDPMSFRAGTEPEDVAVRLLESISPTVQTAQGARRWQELIKAALTRVGLEQYQPDVTALLELRRATLAHILPPLVRPLLVQKRFVRMYDSHEADSVRQVHRNVFGLPFEARNPGKERGIDLFNHCLKVDYDKPHPFRPELNGYTRTFVIVDDDKLPYVDALTPDKLHDSDLLRYQFRHWRYTEARMSDVGIAERGPMKMNDDFGNAVQFIFMDGVPVAAELNYAERMEEMIPHGARLDDFPRLPGGGLRPEHELSYVVNRDWARKQVAAKSRIQYFDEYLRPIKR